MRRRLKGLLESVVAELERKKQGTVPCTIDREKRSATYQINLNGSLVYVVAFYGGFQINQERPNRIEIRTVDHKGKQIVIEHNPSQNRNYQNLVEAYLRMRVGGHCSEISAADFWWRSQQKEEYPTSRPERIEVVPPPGSKGGILSCGVTITNFSH